MGDLVGELRVFVPSNRVGEDGMPTHMDGWNEILREYKKNRHKGASVELENVEWVAWHVKEAMADQGWSPMENKDDAVPCHVHLTFVERDRKRDIPNIHGGAKYAMDALTHRHLRGASAIYDDSRRWCVDVTYGVTIDPISPGMLIVVRAMEPRERKALT